MKNLAGTDAVYSPECRNSLKDAVQFIKLATEILEKNVCGK